LSSCQQVLAEHVLYVYAHISPLDLLFYFSTVTTNFTLFTVLSNHFYSLTSMVLICNIIVIIVLNYVGYSLSTSMIKSVVI
jgi:hypothetical protein